MNDRCVVVDANIARLCKEVDEKDTPYVALTLHLDGRLWTHDTKLKVRLRTSGFDRFYEP